VNSIKPTTALVVAALVAFVAVIAAYVVLAVTGHGDSASGIVPAVVSLLGIFGLGAHTTNRLTKQDQALSTITRQTNGVLTRRIEEGADRALRQVLRESGYSVPPSPYEPEPTQADGPQDPEATGSAGDAGTGA
jgi:hypothetical protein